MSAKGQFHHTNSEVYCSIGIYAAEKELLEVAAVPLKNDFTFSEVYSPYCMKIRPERQIKGHADFYKFGQEHYLTGDLFMEWYEGLELKTRKRLIPVAFNWSVTRPFILHWLGEANFAHVFSRFYRDLFVGGQFLNDVMALKGLQPPFRDRMALRRFVTALGVDTTKQDILHVSKSAMEQARTVAECYKKMVQMGAL